MLKELFLEIGTEEIPAGFLSRALADMEGLLRKELESARLAHGEIVTLATPRRLALVVKDIPAVQPDAEITAVGPAKAVAFDAAGKPTKAAEGFARGQGVDVAALTLMTTDKGEYIGARKPVLACVPEGVVKQTLLESNAAFITPPSDTRAIADAIYHYYQLWKRGELSGESAT